MLRKIVISLAFLGWSAVSACSFHDNAADLSFEPGTTVLTDQSVEKLRQFIASTEKFYYLDHIVIFGYAGKELVSSQRLQSLSLARATSVRSALPALKVSPDRIYLQGFGATRLVPESVDPALNSRVEISALGWRTRPIVCGMCPCFEKEQ